MTSTLSLQQERIWILTEMYPEWSVWNTVETHPIAGIIDDGCINNAIRALFHRHKILRTLQVGKNGIGEQKICDVSDKASYISIEDLSHCNLDQFEDGVGNIVQMEWKKAFNLRSDFPIRFIYVIGKEVSVLIFTTHHIISDRITQQVLWRDLCLLISGEVTATSIKLPIQDVDYFDYIQKQKAVIETKYYEDQGQYWHNELKSTPQYLQFPYDEVVREHNGEYRLEELSINLFDGKSGVIEKASMRMRCVPSSILLAAYFIELSIYTGQTDIVVGMPFLGSRGKKYDEAIGLFVVVLPIRYSINSDMEMCQCVKEVSEKIQNAYNNQDYPFQKIVEILNPSRSVDQHPIFQVMFNYFPRLLNREVDGQLNIFKGYKLSKEYMPVTYNFMPLHLYLMHTNDGLKCLLGYASDYIQKSTADRFIQRYKSIIETIINEPHKQICEIDVVHRDEYERLISVFNNTAFAYNKRGTIVHAIREQSQLFPNDIALTYNSEEVTYGNLVKRIDAIAEELTSKNVTKGSLVGILLEPSFEMISCILAVLQIGAAYLPLDPKFPRERLEYMICDGDVKAILTRRMHARSRWCDRNVIFVDEIGEVKKGSGVNNANPDEMAYLIYTSGSSGTPKGVMVSHMSVMNLVHAMKAAVYLSAENAILCITTMSFDIFVLESLVALALGMRVVIANDEERHDPKMLHDLINKEKIDVIQMTPSRLLALLDNIHLASVFINVKKILVGGEPFPKDLFSKIRKYSAAHVYNMYGPTETTVWSTYKQIFEEKCISIGRPIANTMVYVLDDQQKPQPIGVYGEICIAGDGVAMGYHNNEQLTDHKFIKNPFINGMRMYKTGDIGRWNNDGELETIGRRDNQVKVRGYRIELEEIEHELKRCRGVKNAAAIIRKDRNGIADVAAYVVADNELSSFSIRKSLRERLPDYMIPSSYYMIQEIPRTTNGKIDRKRLEQQVENAIEEKHGYVAPSSDIEKSIAAIWEEHLHVGKIGLNDNFFDLGGHSLLLIKLMLKMEISFGVRPKFNEFVNNSLAQFVYGYNERLVREKSD